MSEHGVNGADVWGGPGRPADLSKVQSILGAVIGAFAAVLSFIGIRTSEISGILRNQEPLIGFVAVAFLLSILAAVLAILEPGPAARRWPTRGLAFGTFLLVVSAGPFLTDFIPVPFVTTGAQMAFGWTVGGVIFVMAALALWFGRMQPDTAGDTSDGTADQRPPQPPVPRIARLRNWLRSDFDRQRYFVVTSILLLAMAAYAAIRIESVSQATPFAQLTARVSATSSGTDVIVLSATAAKVPIPDRVNIIVRGLARNKDIGLLCAGRSMNPGGLPCSVDPCDYKKIFCKTLVGWTLPPDGQGGVVETLVLPFSAVLYQRLQVVDQICERARVDGNCVRAAPVGTTLNIQVAAPGK
jgi:hypothetical protein